MIDNMPGYSSGQRERSVKPLPSGCEGPNPSPGTRKLPTTDSGQQFSGVWMASGFGPWERGRENGSFPAVEATCQYVISRCRNCKGPRKSEAVRALTGSSEAESFPRHHVATCFTLSPCHKAPGLINVSQLLLFKLQTGLCPSVCNLSRQGHPNWF